MEIERKWRLETLPMPLVCDQTPRQLFQGYLVTGPGELRVRTDEETCWITAKSEGALVREEWGAEIPAWTFEQLFATTAHHLEKDRYTLQLADRSWELDIFRGSLTSLILVEAECATEAEAQLLTLPAPFGKGFDVTHDNRYKNKCLAINGIPE